MLWRYHAAGEIANAVHREGSRKPACKLYRAWDLLTPPSRLAQARGLKHLNHLTIHGLTTSRLAQARGLKRTPILSSVLSKRRVSRRRVD